MRNWPAWLGVYGCMTFDSFYSQRWTAFGWMVEYNKVTWGWSLLMIAVFCSLLFRWLDMRSDGVTGEDTVMRSETDAPPAPATKTDDSLSLSK